MFLFFFEYFNIYYKITENFIKTLPNFIYELQYEKFVNDPENESKKLFEYLYEQGITLVTNVKKNMKNRLIPIMDKLLLRKRSVIETVNDQLKNLCDIEHSRSRSPVNFMVNMIAGLIRYTYSEKLPSINFSQKDREILGFPISKTPLKSDENSVYRTLFLSN